MTAPNPYLAFALILAVQLAWFLLVSLYFHTSVKVSIRHLFIGLVYGLPLGIGFDVVAGLLAGVFSYRLPATGTFFLINAILSYGLTVSTVLAVDFGQVKPLNKSWLWALAYFGLCACALITFAGSGFTVLTKTMALGASVLFASELLVSAMNRTGLITELINGSKGGFIRLWIFSIATGIVYELANAALNVWRWRSVVANQFNTHMIIVILGYFVLIYPAYAITSVFQLRRNFSHGSSGL